MAGFMARQIRLRELRDVINELVEGEMEDDYFGICASEVACIYFTQEDGKLNIEFEAMERDQLPFLDKLKAHATWYRFPVVETTHGAKTNYDKKKVAPVLRIETRATVEQAASIGEKIMRDVFGCDDSTTFDVVP